MNRPRQKGTRGENYFLAHLRTVWPAAERAPLRGTLDRGDYVNVPFLIEAKNTERPLFKQWVRVLRVKAGGSDRWVLVWKGDARTADGQPIMIIDFHFGMELLAMWQGTLENFSQNPTSTPRFFGLPGGDAPRAPVVGLPAARA